MQRQFEEELEEIKRSILSMAGLVEKCLEDIASSLTELDVDLAEAVIARDEEIDQYEVEIARPANDKLTVLGDGELTSLILARYEFERVLCHDAATATRCPSFRPVPT